MKAGIGMVAGCCGAFVGCPAEVALIRMTSDGNLPADQRRNYKSAFDALVRTGSRISVVECRNFSCMIGRENLAHQIKYFFVVLKLCGKQASFKVSISVEISVRDSRQNS